MDNFDEPVISIYPVEKTEDGYMVMLVFSCKTEKQAHASADALETLICGEEINPTN